jgi:transposase
MKGRKTKLNNSLMKRFLEVYAQGFSIKTCCESVDIEEKTFYNWKERKNEKEYSTFFQSLSKLDVSIQSKLLEKISTAQDWRAQAWILERRFPNSWSKQEKVDITSNNEKIESQVVIVKIPDNGRD